MSRNLFDTRNGNIVLPLPVASGTVQGQVVFVGSLLVYTLTERVTTASLNDLSRILPQGLKDGEASCEVVGINLAVNLLVANAVTLGAPVYRVTADGTYSATATGGVLIGYALAAQAGAGTIPVGLSRV